ncbi:MAG: CDP-alcohol phosphatidyltransferase family protein [Miltoncostaeaceae bacterium]
MIDAALRSGKERVLAPVAVRLPRAVGPGVVTALALAAGLAAAGATWAGVAWAALALWLVNRVLDGLDGVVARARGAASPLGGYLDMLLDVVVYTAIPLGIAAHLDTRTAWLAAALLLGAFYVNAVSWAYLAALIEARGAGARARGEMTSVTMPRGLVEGAETIVLFAVALAAPAWAVATMFTMAALVMVGPVQRAAFAVRELGA